MKTLNRLNRKLQHDKGATLLEAMVALGFVAILIGAATSLISNYFVGTMTAIQRGDEERAREFIRRSIDCAATVRNILKQNSCSDSFVDVYRSNETKITNKSQAIVFGPYSVMFYCEQSGSVISITPQMQSATEGGLTNLFRIPIVCSAPKSNWYRAYKQNCPAFCNSIGLTNTRSPDDVLYYGASTIPILGNYCASGENFTYSACDAFAAGVFEFNRGTWGATCPNVPTMQNAESVGHRCYGYWVIHGSAQKRDNDSTDDTVACHCE